MNKKILVLLPAAMLVLAGCGGNGGSTTSPTTSTTEPVPATQIVCKVSKTTLAIGQTATLSYEANGTVSGVTYAVAEGSEGTATISGTTLTATGVGTLKVVAKAGSLTSAPVEVKIIEESQGSVKEAYEAAAALAKGATTSEAYTFSGVITSVCGNTFFVQDDDYYGMLVYGGKTSYENVAVGKLVSVTATLKNYDGCLETAAISNVTVGNDGVVPGALSVTSRAQLAEIRQNILVDCTVTMPETLGTWNASTHALVDTKIGSDTDTTKVKFDKFGYSEEQGAIYNKSANKTVTLNKVVTTGFDKTEGSTTSNQLLFVGTSKIEYTAPEITEIKFKTHATKTDYAVGDYYDPTGLELTVKYSDGVEVNVAYADSAADFTFSPSLDTALTSDVTAVKISLKEFKGDPLSQDITVSDKVVKSIEVKQTPTIIDYYVGECFDPTGLIITVTYDKGEPADVAYTKESEGKFDFDPSLTTELTTAHKEVVITYGNKTTTQSITVSEVPATKTDNLTASLFPATSGGSPAYVEFTNVSAPDGSSALYSGNTANKDGAIQLNNKDSNKGIFTPTSGGKIGAVSIVVADGTNTLDIYGKNEPYTAVSDLYDQTKQGKKIGSASVTGEIELTNPGEYSYIGIRANKGAIYLTSISIVWVTK